MWKFNFLLAVSLVAAEAIPKQNERIVGGSTANISQFPFAAVVLSSRNNAAFRQDCCGTIINNRSILSAAHCWVHIRLVHRIRVGSTHANSGGFVHNVDRHITHPDYIMRFTIRSDIGIIRLASAISFGGNVRAAPIPGANFHIADNTNVWAIGWGLLASGGSLSETLQHVQLRIINHSTCQRSHNAQNVNARTICAGWHTNGRGPCNADSGGPLVHNGVAIGVLSFGGQICGDARWPSVYARVSSYSNWIRNNA